MTKRVLAGLLAVIAIAAFFRFYKITEIPPGLYPDESMNGNNAVEAIRDGEYKIFYPENNGREGLFINIQSLAVRAFGTKPWALRCVSAVFGTLTVVGLFFLVRELFREKQETRIKNQESNPSNPPEPSTYTLKPDRIALFASFFLATSFWHVNFSRISFRAIAVPFFLVWSFFFLYRMIRELREGSEQRMKAELFAVLGGILFGAGFHTYIAYRVAPPLLLWPLVAGWMEYRRGLLKKCFPCLFTLSLFAAFVTALPMGYYFLTHPEDFVGRSSQVSVFASENPLQNLGVNIVKTAGMFFVAGDYNWRHNFAGAPELWWPIAIVFGIGMLLSIGKLFTAFQDVSTGSKIYDSGFKKKFLILKSLLLNLFVTPYGFLLVWFALLSVPLIISNEGLPHALRAIGMIPPTMVFAALGLDWMIRRGSVTHEKLLARWSDFENQIRRIGTEFRVLLYAVLIVIAIQAFNQYFLRWAGNPHVYGAFNADYTALGQYLDSLPDTTRKYVIVNAGGVEVRGVPMPAQPVMYALGEGSATLGVITPRNTVYILPKDIEHITYDSLPYGETVFSFLKLDKNLRAELREAVPQITYDSITEVILIGKVNK